MVTLTAVRTQAARLGLRKTFVMWPRCPSQAHSSQMTPEAIWSFILCRGGAPLGLGTCCVEGHSLHRVLVPVCG